MKNKKLACSLTEVCMKAIIKSADVLFFLLLHASVVCLGTFFFFHYFWKRNRLELPYCLQVDLWRKPDLLQFILWKIYRWTFMVCWRHGKLCCGRVLSSQARAWRILVGAQLWNPSVHWKDLR